jgi:acyl-CoA thioesterase-1
MHRFLVALLGPAVVGRHVGWCVRSLLVAGLLTLGTASFAMSAASPATHPARTLLVLGDSLSAAHNIATDQGWVHLLENRLAEMEPPKGNSNKGNSNWRVVNASISGETSLSGRQRLPALLATLHPDVVVIELGANDGLRGLPLARLRENLDTMIIDAQHAHARVLLLGIELPLNYGPQYRDGLRAVYADLAKSHHVALVPFLLQGVATDPQKMQDDGLHPTAAGEPQVLDTVWAGLEPLLR